MHRYTQTEKNKDKENSQFILTFVGSQNTLVQPQQ
jgi:hypothetical protein